MLEPYELALMVAGGSRKYGVDVFDSALSRRVLGGPAVPSERMVLVDAGSRSVRGGGGEASIVKLAVLEYSAGMVRVLHPAVPPYGYPFMVFEGGDNVRRGLTYLVELASLLAQADRGVVYAVRHGPLQQVHYYLRSGYDVDRRLLQAALHYAGLDANTVNNVLLDSELCGHAGLYNVGLAILSIVRMLLDRARNGVVVAGVVENVSRSRALLGSLVRDVVAEAYAGGSGGSASLGRLLMNLANEFYEQIYSSFSGLVGCGDPLSCMELMNKRCFCVNVKGRLVSSSANFDNFVYELTARLRLHSSKPLNRIPEGRVALEASSLLSEHSDPMLLFWLYYLGLGGGSVFTKARPRLAAYEATVDALEARSRDLLGCRSGDARGLADPLRSVYFLYMAPEPPPSCLGLERSLGSLASACELAQVIRVAVPTRVELLLPQGSPGSREEELLAFLYWSARLAAYKYPAPLLLVDKFSRVAPDEMAAAEMLAALVSRIRVPYSALLHNWETRVVA